MRPGRREMAAGEAPHSGAHYPTLDQVVGPERGSRVLNYFDRIAIVVNRRAQLTQPLGVAYR
jgi:hypothetical protein